VHGSTQQDKVISKIATYLASNIGNSVVVHVTVGSSGVSAVAGPGMATVDEGLNRGNDVTVLTLGLDLETVSEGGEGGMRPARATVHGDVLIEVGSQQTLLTVIQGRGEVFVLDVGMGLRGLHFLTSGEAIIQFVAVGASRDGEGGDDGSGEHYAFWSFMLYLLIIKTVVSFLLLSFHFLVVQFVLICWFLRGFQCILGKMIRRLQGLIC
jgi:hypothetical protein